MENCKKAHIFSLADIPYREISEPSSLPPQPLVSVRMITYNHRQYIAEAIEAVVNQETSFPFELVIGEDCSTDGTREKVLDLQRKHPGIIRVITSDKNVGMSRNSVRTTYACRGKYIAFCEGDDFWHNSNKLQIQVDYLENHPECGLVYSDFDVLYTETGKRFPGFIRNRNLDIPEKLSIYDIIDEKVVGILTLTVVLRRDLCLQVMEGDPFLHQSDYFLMGDTQFWAEMAMTSELHYIPESLATHGVLPESAAHSKDFRKIIRFAISGSELLIYLYDKYGLPPEKRRTLENKLNDLRLRLSFYDNDRDWQKRFEKRLSR